jgi:hypothetical protein
MYPYELYQQHIADALRQAEQQRLARLARPKTASQRLSWTALQQRISMLFFWGKMPHPEKTDFQAAPCCPCCL